jgi:hypothetical protein
VDATAREGHTGVGLPELRSGQGRTDKLPGSGGWHPPFPAWSPKAPARSLPPIIKRTRASCPFCLDRHPASVRRSCAAPSMAARAPSSRTPGLRSVTPVRSPLLVPRRCAFPTFGRYDPATDGVATSLRRQGLSVIQTVSIHRRLSVLSRFVPSSAGRRPATGLAHWRAIRARLPSASAL